MRRVLALVGRWIAASKGHNEKTPSPLSLAGKTWGHGDSGGAIGSLEDFTPIPGGVRIPGAPLHHLFILVNLSEIVNE